MDSSMVMNIKLANDDNSFMTIKHVNNESQECLKTPDSSKELLENLSSSILNQSFVIQQCNLHSGEIINLENDDIKDKSECKLESLQITNTQEENHVGCTDKIIYDSEDTQTLLEKVPLTVKLKSCIRKTSASLKKSSSPKKSERKKNGKPKRIITGTNSELACFKCDVCSQEFKTHNLLQKHMHDHIQEKPYHCPKCSASFNVPVNFTLHLATHNVGEPKCPECGRKFARIASLKAHMLVHQVDESLYCLDCDDTFETKMQLEAHTKLHNEKWSSSDTKKCKLCQKKFTQPFLYRRHLREHYKMQIKSVKQTKKGIRHRSTYKCKICLKMFEKPSQLTRHILVHTGEKPFKCSLCNRSFTQKGSLRIHMWQHSGIRPYDCSLCHAKFTQKGNLDSHVRRVHKIQEGVPVYRCNSCPCIFKKLGSLNIHYKRIHSNKQISLTDKDLQNRKDIDDKNEAESKETLDSVISQVTNKNSDQITECQKKKEATFRSSQNYDKSSVESEINQSESVMILDKTTGQKNGKYIKINQRYVDNIRFYDCSYCNKHFKKPSDLMRHLRVHTQEKPFKCEICSRTFTLKSTLLMHKKTHNKFSCPECNLSFSSEKALQIHNNKLHMKNFECAICKETFISFEEIKIHSAVHNPPSKKNQKEITSEVQKIELSEPLVLTEMRNGVLRAQPKHRNDLTNGKGRPHKCTVCTAAFMKVSHLKQHLRRHTGERPFTCSICSRKFTTKSSLKAHHRTHDLLKPYSCPTCAMNFTTLSSMRRHHVTHSNKRPFMCPYCHKTFKAAVNCRKHMKIHRSEIAEQLKQKIDQQSMSSISDQIKNVEKELNFINNVNCNNYYNNENDKFSTSENSAIILSEYDINEPITAEKIEEANQSLNQQIFNDGVNISINNENVILENQDQPILNIIYNDSIALPSPLLTSPEANLMSQLNYFDFNQLKLLNINEAEILSIDSTYVNNLIENKSGKTLKFIDDHKKLDITNQNNSVSENNLVINKLPELKEKRVDGKEDLQNTPNDKICDVQNTYKCYECNQQFPTSLKLREHIKEHVKQELKLKNSLGSNEIIIDDLEDKDKNVANKKSKECMYCSKVFRKPSDLVRHIRTHTGERPFECQFCDKRFAVKCTLDSHIIIHTGEKPYSCHICGFSLATKSGLRNHMLIHNGAKPFKCQICDMKFRTVRQRKVHLLSHVEDQILPNSTAPETIAIENLECVQVECNFKQSEYKHEFKKQEFSKNEQNSELVSTEVESSFTDIQTIEQIVSNSENTMFTNETSFISLDENNQLLINSELNYFLENSFITIHAEDSNVSHELPTSTTSPRNDFTPKNNFHEAGSDSQLIYTEADSTIPVTENDIDLENCVLLQLEDVDSTILIESEKDTLKESESLSTTRRECEVCGKSFAKPCQLERHKRTHTGERPFACDLCEKAFSQKSSLQLHRKRHTGDRPYACEHCGHSFTQKGNLQTHLRRVHKLETVNNKRKLLKGQCDQNQIVLKTILEEGRVISTNDISVVKYINCDKIVSST